MLLNKAVDIDYYLNYSKNQEDDSKMKNTENDK